jgi:AraC-like DNA-binding protein
MESALMITRARHAWPEKAGFTIERPRGLQEYTFLHFFESVELLVEGEVVTTPPGAVIFYAPDTPQWFHSPGPLTHDWMHMTGPVAALLASAGLESDKLYLPGNSHFITPILRQIELEVLTRQSKGEELSELKFRELLILLARSCAGQEEKPDSAAVKRLRQVRSTVFSQLEKVWTVQEMATLAFLSPSRFHALYRAVFGISPMDDLIRARIDTAQNRLTDTEEPVQNVAEGLGYRNVTHFCRQFKHLTGMTPTAFRAARER